VSTGLRERKKRETHHALSQAARELVQQRGLEHVTVDDIAAAADVSVRTFFNYFSCKEEAVVGVEQGVLEDLADEVRRRPEGEGPVDTLRAVLLAEADPGAILRRWQLRNELVRRYPALLPRHLATSVQIEEALARALADRAGRDLADDPAPRIFVAAALAALRAALAWWEESDGGTPLAGVLDAALAQLVPDLPRNP
jgi:AcrR family transcriptional regulator